MRRWAAGWAFWLTWRLAQKRHVGFLSVAVQSKDSELVLARLAAAVELLRRDWSTSAPRTLRLLIGEGVAEHFFSRKSLVVLPIEGLRQLDVDRLAKVIEEYAVAVQA